VNNFLEVLPAIILGAMLVVAAAESRKVAANRGLVGLWWAVMVVLLALWVGWVHGLFGTWLARSTGLLRWFFSGQGRFLNYRRWLLVWLGSIVGIALILAWDWLIYRRLPHARWRAQQKRKPR